MSKAIALIDWNWMGHHPTYFTHFAAAMTEAGAEVIPFCSEPADFKERLDGCGIEEGARRRIHEPTKVFGMQHSGFRPLRWRRQYEALRFFWGHSRRLRRWQAKHGRKIDLVFFACIYDRHFEHFRLAERFFGFPWSGLYLHARSFRMPGSPLPYQGGLPCPERFLTMHSMQSVGILDEGIVAEVQAMSGGKPVHVFPDITVETLRDEDGKSGLAAKLKRFATGRPIVSLTGHLQWTKGLDVFTSAAQHPAMRNVFFFLAGNVNWNEIAPEERQSLQRQWARTPNMFAHLQDLPEEEMNAVIAASDVVFAAYRSFPNSSNVLTKAAVFERPMLVSDGYLMAERVRGFGLGEVVAEGDVEASVEALVKMLEPDYYPKMVTTARWAEYRTLHSQDRLERVFRDLLAVVSGG
jgi:hypothetical protein